jgi:hypothetical protein
MVCGDVTTNYRKFLEPGEDNKVEKEELHAGTQGQTDRQAAGKVYPLPSPAGREVAVAIACVLHTLRRVCKSVHVHTCVHDAWGLRTVSQNMSNNTVVVAVRTVRAPPVVHSVW